MNPDLACSVWLLRLLLLLLLSSSLSWLSLPEHSFAASVAPSPCCEGGVLHTEGVNLATSRPQIRHLSLASVVLGVLVLIIERHLKVPKACKMVL